MPTDAACPVLSELFGDLFHRKKEFLAGAPDDFVSLLVLLERQRKTGVRVPQVSEILLAVGKGPTLS